VTPEQVKLIAKGSGHLEVIGRLLDLVDPLEQFLFLLGRQGAGGVPFNEQQRAVAPVDLQPDP
jgi:hypothetical protein